MDQNRTHGLPSDEIGEANTKVNVPHSLSVYLETIKEKKQKKWIKTQITS
jgi:hypothetical protein